MPEITAESIVASVHLAAATSGNPSIQGPNGHPGRYARSGPLEPELHRNWSSTIRHILAYGLLGLLIWSAWRLSLLNLFKAGDDIGYWLGVAGGSMMAILLLYTFRKHVKLATRWGSIKWWLWAHMSLGIFGPMLILMHTTFHVGSLNAAIALYSMLIVAFSGIVGRFLLVQMRANLALRQKDLQTLKDHVAGLDLLEVRSRLAFAPKVEARLRLFDEREAVEEGGLWRDLRSITVLPVIRWSVYRQCVADMTPMMKRVAARKEWTPEEYARREARYKKLVENYTRTVLRVAQSSVWSRLFAFWHFAHLPFVYMLIGSALVHVYAVHVY